MTDWTHVQSKQTTTASGTSTNTISFTSPVGVGNVPIGTIMVSSGNPIISIVDDKGNKYLLVGMADDGVSNIPYGFYPDPDVNGGLIPGPTGPTTLTITTVGNTATFWANIAEFTPPTGTTAICLDGSQYLDGTALAALPNFATLNNDTLIFAASYSSVASTTGAGFTADAGSGTQQCSEYKIQATAGAASVAFATQTGSSWMVGFALAPVRRTHWIPIQSCYNHSGSTGLSISASLPGAIANGDYVFGMFANQTAAGSSDTSNLASFTDDKGKTWPVNTLSPNFNGRTLFFLGPFTNGAKTITANVNVSSAGLFLSFAEFRPPPNTASIATDGYAENQTGTTSATVGPITTTKNGDLLVVMCEPGAGGSTPTNNFNVVAGPFSTWSLAYLVQPAAGSVSSSWSFNSGVINQYIAGFSFALGGGAQSMWTNFQEFGMKF